MTYRPNELEYRDALASIQSSLENLLTAPPSLQALVPLSIKKLRQRESLIEQALQETILPPLDDSLKNPLKDPAKVRFVEDVMQMVLNEMQADQWQEEDDFWMLN